MAEQMTVLKKWVTDHDLSLNRRKFFTKCTDIILDTGLGPQHFDFMHRYSTPCRITDPSFDTDGNYGSINDKKMNNKS